MRNKRLKLLLSLALIMCMMLSQALFAAAAPSSSSKTDLDYLRSVMDMIKERHKGDVTDQQLIEGALKGMFGSMDPYTTYFTPDQADSFLSEVNGIYDGIGISMGKSNDYIIVVKVFPLSPAEKSGLMPGDRIASLDGKSIIGISLEEASALIKGEAGTKVTLGIVRSGTDGILYVPVTRERIKLNPVTYEIKDGIAYIRLDTFNTNTAEFMAKALDDADAAGVNKIILDLRNNPGGDVDQAVSLAQHFVPEGLVTKLDFQSEAMADKEYYSKLKNPKYKPAILVNGLSASASEIVVGAVQDTKAGTIIGTKTFGKAKVQNLVPMLTPEAYAKYEKQLGVKVIDALDLINKYKVNPRQDEIIGWSKITTGLYYTPKGRMIDEQGITPDILVEDPVPVAGVDITSIQKLAKATKPGLNSESTDVYNAEKILKILGYDVDVPDPILDEKTAAAISQFRSDNGLYPGDMLDFTTQDILNSKLESEKLRLDAQYSKAVEVLNK